MRTKDKKYLHSTVEVEDIPFPIIKLKDIEEYEHYKKIVDQYNSACDITEKEKLSEKLPDEFFCKCRFCGKKIINSNFTIYINLKKMELTQYIPSIKTRKIDGKEYELSCCEECLKNNFVDNPPKSQKYYFMKANKYGAYSYGYSYDEYKKICSATTGITKETMIRKYGEIDGIKRWNEYCQKQAETNSYEYKKEKYGWTKNDFEEFNKNRAVTEELCIKRHGKEDGLKIWKEYCDRQRYTTTLEYFVEEYGQELGTEKYKNFYNGRLFNGFGYSKMSQECFNRICKILNEKYDFDSNNIMFATHNKEYMFISDDHKFKVEFDFYDKENNIIVEFYGSLWHADPKLYDASSIVLGYNFNNKSETTAKEIWDHDKERLDNIKKYFPNCKIFIIWESDWRKDPDKAIEPVLHEYSQKLK